MDVTKMTASELKVAMFAEMHAEGMTGERMIRDFINPWRAAHGGDYPWPEDTTLHCGCCELGDGSNHLHCPCCKHT